MTRLQRGLRWALEAGLAGAVLEGFRRRDPSVIVNGVLSIALVSMPRMVEGRREVRFRSWQRLWVSTAAVVHTVGLLGPYDRIWWWDHVAHALSGGIVAAVADIAHTRTDLGTEGVVATDSRHRFVVGVTVVSGVVWEVLEYVVHALGNRLGFEPLLVHYGRLDAVGDVVFDLLGAGFVLLYGHHHIENLTEGLRDRA